MFGKEGFSRKVINAFEKEIAALGFATCVRPYQSLEEAEAKLFDVF